MNKSMRTELAAWVGLLLLSLVVITLVSGCGGDVSVPASAVYANDTTAKPAPVNNTTIITNTNSGNTTTNNNSGNTTTNTTTGTAPTTML